jgi:hypothetical protein
VPRQLATLRAAYLTTLCILPRRVNRASPHAAAAQAPGAHEAPSRTAIAAYATASRAAMRRAVKRGAGAATDGTDEVAYAVRICSAWQ